MSAVILAVKRSIDFRWPDGAAFTPRRLPANRGAGWASRTEIAALTAYLAPYESAYMTGQALMIDGGMTM